MIPQCYPFIYSVEQKQGYQSILTNMHDLYCFDLAGPIPKRLNTTLLIHRGKMARLYNRKDRTPVTRITDITNCLGHAGHVTGVKRNANISKL